MALSIATFNVENLFEPDTDEARAILAAKLDAIGALLDACDADVVALQEVGSGRLLDDVLRRLVRAGPYRPPVLGTKDARGIGCALLSRVAVLSRRVHTSDGLPFPVFVQGDPPPFGARIPLRRGIVEATVDGGDLGAVHVFVAHFKSPRPVPIRDASGMPVEPASERDRAEGDVRSFVWRAAEALYLRGLVDAALGEGPDTHVAVAGDFNDTVDSVALGVLRGTRDRAGALIDASSGIPPELRYTCLHEGQKRQIDHVLVTAGLGARVQQATIHNAGLREHAEEPKDGTCQPLPLSDADVGAHSAAASDHAPLVVRFG